MPVKLHEDNVIDCTDDYKTKCGCMPNLYWRSSVSLPGGTVHFFVFNEEKRKEIITELNLIEVRKEEKVAKKELKKTTGSGNSTEEKTNNTSEE